MAKANLAAVVRALIEPTVVSLGFRLWDVEFAKEGADWHLTVTIDSDDGIDILDCEAVHRAIDPLLDEADPIEVSYCLDVSSPGIERELRTDEHILASVGALCEAKLFAPRDGKKCLRGTLTAYRDGILTLQTEAGETVLPRTDVSKLRTVFFD